MSYWPADVIERRAVDSLIPFARNSRTHSDEQVAQVAAAIREGLDEPGALVEKFDLAAVDCQTVTALFGEPSQYRQTDHAAMPGNPHACTL